MDSLLPSETARLVLGYLEEECDVAAKSLLENCPYLQECYLMARQGRAYSTRPYNKSLKQILEEYCAIRSLVSDRLKKLPESSSASLTQCSLVEQLSHLMGLSRSGQTLLVSITMPPQGSGSDTVQTTATSPLSQTRMRSRQSSSSERVKRLSVRWQGADVQQPPQEVEPVTSVEATPAKSLPGFSPSEDVESDRELPGQAMKNKQDLNCSHLDDSEIIAPIGSGSCTSTPKRRMSCSKRKATPSTKGSPPSVKGVASSVRQRRSLSEEEPSESINLTFLTQAFLENKELHQKIAENINKVIGSEQHVPAATQPLMEASCSLAGQVGEMSQEMDNVVKTIVSQTEQDPLFERFLEDLIGPVEALREDEAEQEAEGGEKNHDPSLVMQPKADNCSATPKPSVLEVPLKQRLRNARHKKDSKHAETPAVQKEKVSNQTLEGKTDKSSQQCTMITSGNNGINCPASLELQNAVAIESIVNVNAFPQSKQSAPVLTFNTTLGHLVSGDISSATSHDHNAVMSTSCIDRLTKEVASLQSDKYPFMDGNVSLPSFGGSFNLGSDTLKTANSVNCVASQSTTKDSTVLVQKPLCSSEVAVPSHSRNIQEAYPVRFSGETSVKSTSAHGSSQQDSGVTNSGFLGNISGGGHTKVMNSVNYSDGKIADSAGEVFSATLLKNSEKAVYNVVYLSPERSTENEHNNFPSSFPSTVNHTSVVSASKAMSSSPVSVVSAGSQQSVCSMVSVMSQQSISSLNRHYLCGSTAEGNKLCFSHPSINMQPDVGKQTSDLAVCGTVEMGKTVCEKLGNFSHVGSCSNLGLATSFVAEDGGTVFTHIPVSSGSSLQSGQVLSVNISEEGTMVAQTSAGQVMPLIAMEKGAVNLSQPLTESQLMQMPVILCGSEKNVQLINILKPAACPPAPVVSRKKGYIPILPKKKQPSIGKKLIVFPNSPSLGQENVGQQVVVMPAVTNSDSVTVYSCPVSEEAVHFSDSNPCTKSLPTICVESPVVEDPESRENQFGELNELESNNEECTNISENVMSPQLMKLVDLSKTTVSSVAEVVSKCETNTNVTFNNVSHEASTQEIHARKTPIISSGLKRKGSNSRRLSLSTPRRKRSHIRTLDFSTPLKRTSVRKSNTSPKGSMNSPSSATLPKSVRRMSLFKSPINRIPAQSPILESHVDLDATATMSPAPTLSGSWDKFTGAGLIIPESSPVKKSENQCKTTVDSDSEFIDSVNTDVAQMPKRKVKGTWDSALRALLSPNYSDPEPPSKNSWFRKERVCPKKKTIKKAKKTEVTRPGKRQSKISLVERNSVSVADSEAVDNLVNQTLPQIPNKSKPSVRKQRSALQTPVKQSVGISMQNECSSEKGLARRVKNKHNSQDSCGLCCSKKNSPLKINTKKQVKRNRKSPVKSNPKTPLKKTPFKNKANMPLSGKASTPVKCKKIVQRKPRRKTKSKMPGKMLKVCMGKIDDCYPAVPGCSNNSEALKKNNLNEDNIVLAIPDPSEENACRTDDAVNSDAGNIKLLDSNETENANIIHTNSSIAEKNKSLTRKKRKNPSPSKSIHKIIEKEKDGVTVECEIKMPVGVISALENTTSKVVQSPTNLKAAKRTLVRNQLMAGRKLDLSEECCSVNSDGAEHVASCSQATDLDTPEKADTGINVSLIVPMTPRIISPRLVEDTPITKLIKQQIASYDDTIMTPSFPCTPNIPVTPRSLEAQLIIGASPSEYPSRPTDYSSSSSYYQPSDDHVHQHKSLEQVLIDECCRMEANKMALESGITEVNTVTVPDDEQLSSSKPVEMRIETTVPQNECSLQQSEFPGDCRIKECVQIMHQNEDNHKIKLLRQKVVKIMQEDKSTDMFSLVGKQSFSDTQDATHSQMGSQPDSPQQDKHLSEGITPPEEITTVGEQKAIVLNQTAECGTMENLESGTYTTKLISYESPPGGTESVVHQGNDDRVEQTSLIEEKVAVVENNSDGVNFVTQRENIVGVDSSLKIQNEETNEIGGESSAPVDEENIIQLEKEQEKQVEEGCVESVAAGHLASENSDLNFDQRSEENIDSLQQSCLHSFDKVKSLSPVNENYVHIFNESSMQTEKLSSKNYSCARTSFLNFANKCAKSGSNNKTECEKDSAKTKWVTDSSSSEDTSSSEENAKFTSSMQFDSKTEHPPSHSDVTNSPRLSKNVSVSSSELFGNCSGGSGRVESSDTEDGRETAAVIHSEQYTSKQNTVDEKLFNETTTELTASSQNPDLVRKNILDTVQDCVNGSNSTHSVKLSNTCKSFALQDGKLFFELEEKRLRTLAKLKEPLKAKRKSIVMEFSGKLCNEKITASASKVAAEEGKPDQEAETLSVTETTRKLNPLRKQGVNAIAERLRKQQQAVSKFSSPQEELTSADTRLSNSDIERKLSDMYGELDLDAHVADVPCASKNKAKTSSKILPVRTLEDILSSTDNRDRVAKPRKRRLSDVDRHGCKNKTASHTFGKFPKLSLRDSSAWSSKKQNRLEINSSRKQNMLESSRTFPEADKPNSSDVPVSKINRVENHTECVSQKEVLFPEKLQPEGCCETVLNLGSLASGSTELEGVVVASSDSATTHQKHLVTKKSTRKELNCSSADAQATAVDETLDSESNYVERSIPFESCYSETGVESSDIHVSAVKSDTCKVHILESKELSLKILDKSATSVKSLGKVKLSPKSKITTAGKKHTVIGKSVKKAKKFSSVLNSSDKIKKKETIAVKEENKHENKFSSVLNSSSKIKKKETVAVKEENKLLISAHESLKEEVSKEVNTVAEVLGESVNVAESSGEKSPSDVSDTNNYRKTSALLGSPKHEMINLNRNNSITNRDEASSQTETEVNVLQLCDNEKEGVLVSPKLPIFIGENSCVSQHSSEELNPERTTNLMIRNISQGKETSLRLSASTEDSIFEENSCYDSANKLEAGDRTNVSSNQEQNLITVQELRIFEENSCYDSANKLEAGDRTNVSSNQEQNLTTVQELHSKNSGDLMVESSFDTEDVSFFCKNKNSKFLTIQDRAKVLLEMEIPAIEENCLSSTEKLISITYKNDGPHLECEPSPFEWNDCFVKLLVDDFEVTCSVTPLVELLNLMPDIEDSVKEGGKSVSNRESSENKVEETNKFHNKSDYSDHCGSHKTTNKKLLLKVPKKLAGDVLDDREMISPLINAYNGEEKGRVCSEAAERLTGRFGTENDIEKNEEKKYFFNYHRKYGCNPPSERYTGRLEIRKKPHYSMSNTRKIFYRKSSERQLFQDSDPHHEKKTKLSNPKHSDDVQEGRHRMKYSRNISNSRSRSAEKPYFYTNRRELAQDDHDLRARDSSHGKSAKQYMPEVFDDGMDKRPDSKYFRHKGREDYRFHKKNRGEVSEEKERNHMKNTHHPDAVVDEFEEKTKNRNSKYSSCSRPSNSHRQSGNETHEREARMNRQSKSTIYSSSRSEGNRENLIKKQHSRINTETICGTTFVTKKSKDSEFSEKKVENQSLSKVLKPSSISSRIESKNSRASVSYSKKCSSDKIYEQFDHRRKRDVSEDKNISDDDVDDYLCSSGPEQENQNFPLEKSSGRQMCDDELMTYAIVGSPSRTLQSHSSQQTRRNELAAEKDSSLRDRSVTGNNTGKEDVRTLPPKKRKASSEEISSRVEKKECLESAADPQTLLKKVGLENFLTAVHGKTT